MARTARSGSAPDSSSRAASRSSSSAASSGSPRAAKRKYVGWRVLLNPLWCYWGFMASVIVVTVFGLLMVFSSSSVDAVANKQSPWNELASQGIFCAVGIGFALATMHVPSKAYQRFGAVFMIFAWCLQMLTFTPLGRGQGGNSGWIYVFGFTFQPAELLKLALCIWMPTAMATMRRQSRVIMPAGKTIRQWLKGGIRPLLAALAKVYGVPMGAFIVSFGLVMGGKDLGTGLIILLIGFVAFLTGGFPLKGLLAGAIVGGAGIFIVFVSGSGNRMSRLQATYGTCSEEDMRGSCWQIVHGMYAMGSGGLFGVGLGNSREKWNYLPEAHNDFIFAIIGEELGFVGAALLVIGFVVMGWCLIVVALQMRDAYARASLVLIASWIVGQALVNIAVVLKILPVIGLPMPFVSSGGSALVMCLGAAGVAVQMMRQQPDIKAALVRA